MAAKAAIEMTSSAIPAASQVQRTRASTLSDPATSEFSAAAAAVKSPTATIATAAGTTARDHPGLAGRLARLSITGAVPPGQPPLKGRTPGAGTNYLFLPIPGISSAQARRLAPGHGRHLMGRPGRWRTAEVTGGLIACQTAAMDDAAARAQGRVRANDIELAYETFGDPGAPPVVLIMGLAMQMIAWPDELCEGLARCGLFVVRFDNRDVGGSTLLRDLPPPRLADIVARRKPPYSIGDMAGDVAGLLDGLGLGQVHLVGASMGGFIAQAVALAHPDRVRTLTLMMTSTGSRRV